MAPGPSCRWPQKPAQDVRFALLSQLRASERGPELFTLRRLGHLRQRRQDFLLCVINILQRVMEQVIKRLGFLRHRGAPLFQPVPCEAVRTTDAGDAGSSCCDGSRLFGPAPSCTLCGRPIREARITSLATATPIVALGGC